MSSDAPDTRPSSFGAFKPVNHVVIAFPTQIDRQAAQDEIASALGLDGSSLQRIEPDEMVRAADEDLRTASSLADLGQELNLVRSQRALAVRGHCFLVVPGSGDDAQKIGEIARRHRAARAQAYGRFIIEELVPVGDELSQVAESPDRGLDTQTVAGVEGKATAPR